MITAQFNDVFLPVADGVVQGVRNYAYWLNKKYGTSYVVAPENPGYIDNEEYEVLRFKSIPLISRKPYRLGLPNISFEIRKRILSIPLDIVHAKSPFGAGAFAQQIASEKKIPLVASFHSQYYYDFKEQLKSERLTRSVLKGIARFYEKADAVWTVNEKTEDILRSYGYRGDIEIIGDGIDFKRPEDFETYLKDTEPVHGIENEFVMLYVGQIVWHKNLKLVCEGLAAVKNSGRKFKMIFAGEGKASKELKKLVNELGIDEDTVFLGKVSDRQKIMSLYAHADLFLFPSIYDTFGIVIREAAEMLCPCLMVEGANAAAEIIDGENGFLCNDNIKSFSGVIKKVMDNPDLLGDVGQKAAETLPEDWESIVDRAYGMYEQVIEQYSCNKKK